MTPEEFDAYLQADKIEPVIRASDFPAMELMDPQRLLCKGWHLNGGPNIEVWLAPSASPGHRQLIGRKLDDEETEWRAEWKTADLYPSKRAYREDTDLRFAVLMRDRHIYSLTFTTWRTEPSSTER